MHCSRLEMMSWVLFKGGGVFLSGPFYQIKSPQVAGRSALCVCLSGLVCR